MRHDGKPPEADLRQLSATKAEFERQRLEKFLALKNSRTVPRGGFTYVDLTEVCSCLNYLRRVEVLTRYRKLCLLPQSLYQGDRTRAFVVYKPITCQVPHHRMKLKNPWRLPQKSHRSEYRSSRSLRGPHPLGTYRHSGGGSGVEGVLLWIAVATALPLPAMSVIS